MARRQNVCLSIGEMEKLGLTIDAKKREFMVLSKRNCRRCKLRIAFRKGNAERTTEHEWQEDIMYDCQQVENPKNWK